MFKRCVAKFTLHFNVTTVSKHKVQNFIIQWSTFDELITEKVASANSQQTHLTQIEESSLDALKCFHDSAGNKPPFLCYGMLRFLLYIYIWYFVTNIVREGCTIHI